MLLFLPIVSIFAGLFTGGIVNLFSTELAFRRSLLSEDCVALRQSQGWLFTFMGFTRSESCSAALQFRNSLVLVAYAILGLGCWYWAELLRLPAWLALPVLGYLGIVVVMDMEHKVILFSVAWAGLVLAGVSGLVLRGWQQTVIGGVAGYLIMFSLYRLGESVMRFLVARRGAPADEVALGYGDVNLAGLLGLWLGWPGVLAGMYVAILLGGAVSLTYLVVQSLRKKYSAYTALPYGPFLVAAVFWLLFLRPVVNSF